MFWWQWKRRALKAEADLRSVSESYQAERLARQIAEASRLRRAWTLTRLMRDKRRLSARAAGRAATIRRLWARLSLLEFDNAALARAVGEAKR
jgi:hypothetical protein